MTEDLPRAARRGGTRSVLLEAAAGLLEDGGMGAVTLRAVGERAGVSRQAPYNHFADKATLLSLLAARYLERLGEAIAGAAGEAGEVPGGNPVELAAVLFATTHGAVELALAGHAEEAKGLGDPAKVVRALLAQLRRD